MRGPRKFGTLRVPVLFRAIGMNLIVWIDPTTSAVTFRALFTNPPVVY
jgi:hypothetical protein